MMKSIAIHLKKQVNSYTFQCLPVGIGQCKSNEATKRVDKVILITFYAILIS